MREAVTPETILVSMMAVNNEVGSILPVEAAADAIEEKKAPALLHIDAVQAFGKLPLRVRKLRVDLMSVSAHKIHGPKGIGALYVRKGVHIEPLTYGGGQEKDMRPGTESMPLIAAFGAAVKALPDTETELAAMRELNAFLRAELAKLARRHGQLAGRRPALYSEFLGGRRPRRNHAAFPFRPGNLCFLRLGVLERPREPCAHGDGPAAGAHCFRAAAELLPLQHKRGSAKLSPPRSSDGLASITKRPL